jgi:hypothetical protein
MKKYIIQILATSFIFELLLIAFRRLNSLISAIKVYSNDRLTKELSHIPSEKGVLYGPFKGLRLINENTFLSYNAILGSIEFELHSVVQEIIDSRFDTIINIGASEGYYSVGFALKSPGTNLIAYEYETNHQKRLLQNAKLNGVQDSVKILGLFDQDALESLNLLDGKRYCLFCDCEGYEREILNEKNHHMFLNTDILVEIHDIFYPGISEQIRSVFKESHSIEVIDTVDDLNRPEVYGKSIPELKGVHYNTQKVIMSENRGQPMQWFWMKALKR